MVDRVFTRIGAADDLSGGRSTFMVEMSEAAHILRQATNRSIVLMDEIGRGTSTYDGLSLAWSCANYLAKTIQSATLFATHYFELTTLADQLESAQNVHLDATEYQDDLVFLHKLKPGAASRSYGLQVAKLAGLPASVIEQAKKKLQQLEQTESNQYSQQHTLEQPALQSQLNFNDVHPLVTRLQDIDSDELTPKQAWLMLADLIELAKSEH